MFRHGNDVLISKFLHNATIRSQTFSTAHQERDLPKDIGSAEFCDILYAGTRDVGISRNDFHTHFKDPYPVHKSIPLHSSEQRYLKERRI